jgi:hypothetical protein
MNKNTIQLLFFSVLLIYLTGEDVLSAKKNEVQLDFKNNIVSEAVCIDSIGANAAIRQIAFNPDNQMVIATWDDVFVLNNNGSPPIRLGSEGGEQRYYSGVQFFSIGHLGNIYLADGYSLFVFSKFGKYIKKIPTLPRVSRSNPYFHISSTGDILAYFRYPQNNFVKLVLEKRDSNGKKTDSIHVFADRSARVNKKGSTSTAYHEYMEDYFMTGVLDEELCFASNLDYRLYFYNPKKKEKRSMVFPEKPVSITEEELAYFKRKYQSRYSSLIFPPHRPFFQGLLSDEKGRIYVVRTRQVLDADKKKRTLEVFNKGGKFLFRFKVPFKPIFIHKGRIFYLSKIKGKSAKLRAARIMNYKNIPD